MATRAQRPLAVLLGACLLLSAAAAPAVAATDGEADTPVSDLVSTATDRVMFAVEHPGAVAEALQAGMAGKLAAWEYKADALWGGVNSPSTAASEAADVRAHVNAHNASYEDYINSHIDNASTDYDTFRVNLTIDEETATLYVLGDVETTNDTKVYRNLRVLNATEWADANLNRTVDHSVGLRSIAARQAAEDLETFHEAYVEPGKSIEKHPGFVARLKARNEGNVKGTLAFLPDEYDD